MKKGQRRKDNKRRNKPRKAAHKRKGLRPNPMFGTTMDQGAMRAIVNQALGSAFIDALGIDFVGALEAIQLRELEDKPKEPEN